MDMSLIRITQMFNIQSRNLFVLYPFQKPELCDVSGFPKNYVHIDLYRNVLYL